MSWWINQFGFEVYMDNATENRHRANGSINMFSKRVQKDVGDGPEKRVALIFEGPTGSNGIGDYIHALPALSEKVRQGFEVHTYCADFFEPFVTAAGCVWHDSKENYGVGFMKDYLKPQFGTIYSLIHWCIIHDDETHGNVTVPRFQQIAALIDVELPDKFSWRKTFKLGKRKPPKGPIAIAVQSTSKRRSYWRDIETMQAVSAKTMHVSTIFGGGNAHKMEHHHTAHTVTDLLADLDKCRAVVAVDNGILAIALALEIPVVAVFGPTDANTIIWQFARYVSTANVRTIILPDDGTCQRPCSFQGDRGHSVGGKCKSEDVMSDCLAGISPEMIADEVFDLIQKP